MKKQLLITLTFGLILTSCNEDKPTTIASGEKSLNPETTAVHKDDHGHQHGPNGGELKEIGSVGFIEYFIDEKQSSMTIYLHDKDGKTPLKVTQPPLVMGKLRTNRISEPFAADSLPNNKFQLTHAIFSAHVHLFVAVTLDGSNEPISIPFPHHH